MAQGRTCSTMFIQATMVLDDIEDIPVDTLTGRSSARKQPLTRTQSQVPGPTDPWYFRNRTIPIP